MENKEVISPKEAEEFMKKYKEDMETFKSFGDYIKEKIEQYEKKREKEHEEEIEMEEKTKSEIKYWHIKHFEERTGLGSAFYSRVKSHSYKQPKMRIFMSLVMGYNLGMQTALMLIRPVFRDFDITNKVHRAYIQLMVQHEGKNYKECNEVLKSLGINKKDYLGTHKK